MIGTVLDGVGLLMNRRDNVATSIEDLEAGVQISLDSSPLEGHSRSNSLTLVDDVPFGHKFALIPIEPGDPVLKYGETIGLATVAIGRGEWVHIHNCESARGKPAGTTSGTNELNRDALRDSDEMRGA